MAKNYYNYESIEKKWQDEWFSHKIYEAKKQHQKKFFIHFAYPGVSGYLHVGHMRGFTYCDIIARYKRMQGYDVCFPAGFHASGIPTIGFAKKVERNDPITIKSLQDYGVDEKTIQKLTDPQEVVTYFSHVYVEDYWKKFGFLIDYSRLMSTISPGYKKFIQWQFHQLKNHKLLIQKPHFAPFCPNCGPVAVDKSETDIQTGGNAEIQEFTIIKFTLNDGTILPAATLRPETIFGVTNMWINPDVTYKKIKMQDETWIISSEGAEKLKYQSDKITLMSETIPGSSLIGQTCMAPLINRTIPILSGPFADPSIATGVVMSVPAHAPYDYIALIETKEDIQPITIIDVKEFGENPAKHICDHLNITSQKEIEKLDEATEIVYKKEFHTGILNKNCQDYAGIKVTDIKDQVKQKLIEQNNATLFREFSEEVICRCGKSVIIKNIPDQWFIKYSDQRLTEQTKDHIHSMQIYPEEYQIELPGILDWFDDRACIRKGSWLGTEFPFKKGWIIEPISDSTLYPLYYIISKYINEQSIKPEGLTTEFFDYVFFGKGTPTHPIWQDIRQDYLYWYPVDINLGGKEHKTVHFPVFLMNHVDILPQEMRPQGIFVHWWVTQKGKEKISKSKGGAEHITEASKTYGIDAMRLYYTHVGSPFVDIEWNTETVTIYKQRIHLIYAMIRKLQTLNTKPNQQLDTWLMSILQERIHIINTAFQEYNLRIAANEIFFEIQKDLQWYLKRGGGNKTILTELISIWLRLMTPITPHIAEELWHHHETTLISNAAYPQPQQQQRSAEAEIGEQLIYDLVNDIQEIIKVTKITPKHIYLYTAPDWKYAVIKTAITLSEKQSLNTGVLMKHIMNDPLLKQRAKEVSQYAQKLPSEIQKLSNSDKQKLQTDLNEHTYIKQAQVFLQEYFDCALSFYSADDPDRVDPAQKAKFAVPLRPAIYLE